jgi:putative hydrolase of the HAD superfamily
VPSKLKAIVFDYGDVLSYPEDPARYEKMGGICGLDPELLSRLYRAFRPDYDRGVIRGVEYWQRIASSAGRTLNALQIRQLVKEDIRNTTELNPAMMEWTASLVAAGITLAILSNMTRDDMRQIARRRIRAALRLFSIQLFSSEIGLVKPDDKIFRLCLAALGVSPAQILFIDDKAENVRAARKLGMHAFQFRSFKTSLPVLVPTYRLPMPPQSLML